MMDFVNSRNKYKMEYENVMVGPLKADQYQYLKTITFFVNPDQLGVLMTGAQYNAKLGGPPPVIAPFGSGCSLLIPFDDFDVPQGSIGGTDSAMRENFPPDILTFTVTKPLYAELCALDERSFLYKSFWQGLKKARGIAV